MKKLYGSIRADIDIIADLVEPGSQILDLGCGDGEILKKLIFDKKCRGHGVELYHDSIIACVEKGVPVIHGNLDEGLNDYQDHSFDYVILSRTLQVVHKPHLLLREMIRIGKTCIVSVPNFGHVKVRSYLFFRGRMPVTRELPYQWYDTPNIHLLTVRDFYTLCKAEKIEIIKQINLKHGSRKGFWAGLYPNLFAEQVIFTIRQL